MEKTHKKLDKIDPKKSQRNKIIIIVITIIISVMALTKVGAVPNYFDIEFLCPNKVVSEPDVYNPGRDLPMMTKPVLYLYPEQKQQISVKLTLNGQLTTTYPSYNNGWNVIARPDGKITNKADGREYSYLFWEGVDKKASYDMSSGFVVSAANSERFLQDSLSKLGLMSVEYNEFIVYWLPIMQANQYNLVHFATKAEYDDRAVLTINPKPDSMLRIFMVVKKTDSNMEVQPQDIKTFQRKGFTVIEWGGTSLDL